MNKTTAQRNTTSKTTLYRIVFDGQAMRYVVSFLLVFFVLHPATPAFAAEEPDESGTEEVMNEPDVVEEGAQEEPTVTIVEEDVTLDEEEILNEDAQSDSAQENATGEEGSEDEDIDTEEPLDTEEVSSSTDSSIGVSEDGLDGLNDITDDEENISTSSDDVVENDSNHNTETGSTTQETSSTTTAGSIIDAYVVDSGAYSFTQSQCVEVAGGSFYCTKSESTDAESLSDALYAAPDAEGDTEIYFVQEGKQYQVTTNTSDDGAPSYDPLSESIVWHRLLNDRYQIISYDIKSGKETILTHNTTNDMEPNRSGEFTVWQRWSNNNWEIILLDGEVETQLTETKAHDIGPKINGNYVIWHTTDASGEKKVALYDLVTKAVSVIDDSDDGAIENPRFILMYDKTFSNGDSVTKGIDIVTGEVVPLAASGGTLPTKIPKSDPTGETRALIQSKTNGSKEEHIDVAVQPKDTPNATTTDAGVQAGLIATSTNAATIVVPDIALNEDSTEDEISTSTSHIVDIIIPSATSTTYELPE